MQAICPACGLASPAVAPLVLCPRCKTPIPVRVLPPIPRHLPGRPVGRPPQPIPPRGRPKRSWKVNPRIQPKAPSVSPIALAALLVLGSLTITPAAEAQSGVGYVEGFEAMPVGSVPSSSWFSSYDSTSANGPTGTVTVAATTLTGSQRALAFTPGTTNSYAAVVGQNRDLDLCTTNAGFAFDAYLPAMASGQQLEFLVKGGTFSLATGNPVDTYLARSVGFQVRGTGTSNGATVTPFHDGFFGSSAGAGTNMGTVTTPGLFHVQITNQVCTSIQTRFTFTWGSLTTSLTRNQALTSILNNFYVHADGAPYATTYVDNLAWSGLNHYTHGPNYEDFRNYTLGTAPSKPFYSFTTARGTGPAYPGVLDCIGLASISAQLASRCAYVPPATTQTFKSLVGEFCPVQQDPTGTAALQSKVGFDFAIGQGAWATNGQTKIQLLDNLTAPRNSVTLEGVRVSDGSMAPHTLIVANGVSIDERYYVNAFNQFQDHFGIICKSVPGASGGHTDSVELRSDSHQGFTYSRTIAATDAVQSIFTAPLVYLVVGNLACNSCGGIQVDNLDFPNSLGASVSVSLPGLVGFSADAFDQSVIVRRTSPTGGQDVQTLDPGNLHISGTIHEPNCNRLGGVATRYAGGKVSTSFVNCDTSNNVNQLHIRNENLGAPDFTGTPCEGEGFCDIDISGPFGASGASAPPGNARDVGAMESAPWDYSLGSVESDCLLCVKHATLAWAYSEITGGHVGVYAITMNKNAQDAAATASQVYAPSGTMLADFCAWRDTTTKKDYLAAVRSDGPTKIYQATVKEQQASGTVYHVPVVTLTTLFQGGGGFDNAVSIGCSRNRILVLTADGHAVLANVFGQKLRTWDVPGPMQHSVSMSLDSAFGIIGSTGIYHVLDLINGTDTLQFPVPTGNLYYTGLDFNAKVLWSATSLTANRFELGALLKTQGIPLGSNRNLTGGGLLPCTDAQGNPSSTCTGNADPLPDPDTGTGTGTSTGTGTQTSTDSTSTTATDTGSGTTTGTGTNSTSSTSGTNGTSDGEGGGGGLVDDPQTLPWLVVVAVAVAGGAALLLIYARRRTP